LPQSRPYVSEITSRNYEDNESALANKVIYQRHRILTSSHPSIASDPRAGQQNAMTALKDQLQNQPYEPADEAYFTSAVQQ